MTYIVSSGALNSTHSVKCTYKATDYLSDNKSKLRLYDLLTRRFNDHFVNK